MAQDCWLFENQFFATPQPTERIYCVLLRVWDFCCCLSLFFSFILNTTHDFVSDRAAKCEETKSNGNRLKSVYIQNFETPKRCRVFCMQHENLSWGLAYGSSSAVRMICITMDISYSVLAVHTVFNRKKKPHAKMNNKRQKEKKTTTTN